MAGAATDTVTKKFDQEISSGIQQAITESMDKFTLDQTTDGIKTRRQTSTLGDRGDVSVAEIATEVVTANDCAMCYICCYASCYHYCRKVCG